MRKNFIDDLDRVDGRAKVTGTAQYAAEYSFPNLAYGVMVGSTIAKGTITSLDTKAAENAPGVLAVISHLNLPKLPGYEKKKDADQRPAYHKGYKVFEDNVVRFNSQPIAIVVADTFERATYAASLVKAQYKKDNFNTDLHNAVATAKPIPGDDFKDYIRGDANWNGASKIEAVYEIPLEVHNAMEMHALTVSWDGDDKVTIYEKTQWLNNVQGEVSALYKIPKENVHVICKYIGGAFGSAFNMWPHSIAGVIAAKQVGRPLRVSLSRDQMFTTVGYRPQAIQKITMGTDSHGKLTGITHETFANTASYSVFTEGISNVSRNIYACPNVVTRYKVYPLDVSQPTWMRGPGETTGTFALESAIDEMAYAINMDPLQFRLLNYSEDDPEYNRPHSSKFLREALQIGAERIGWKDRSSSTRSMKDGEWLVGYGTGTGIFSAWRGGSKLGVKLNDDGTLILQSAVTDMGPGTATSMTKLASETFGIAPNKIRFEIGDSRMPPGIFQGGSGTTSSLGTTVSNASVSMKKKLSDLVKDNSLFHTETVHEADLKNLVFENGYIMLASDKSRKISYSDALKNAGIPHVELIEESTGLDQNKYSSFSWAAHFVKVYVHPATGIVRVNKVVTAIDAGKIVNEKTARSQIIGGVIGGIGMALSEAGIIDHRYGRWVNNNFADYHVPVNADVPHIEAVFVNKPDPILNPMGSKGIGEVAMVGFPAAVANAVFHATGKRIRNLPITPDKLV